MRIVTILSLLCVLGASRARAQCQDPFILVTTTDFSTGSTSSLHPVNKTPTLNVEPIHSDAVARYYGGLVYVVNRGGANNIQVLDPCNSFNTLHQFSTGNSSNPHDVFVQSPTVAYVTRYDMTSVLKMNPQTGATLAIINLATFADADGIPEMDQMFVNGNRLYVTIQRLDRNFFYSPTGTSYLAVIDLTTDTVVDMSPAPGVQAITLLEPNPYSEIVTDPSHSANYISCVGFFGVNDSGVLSLDPADPTQQMMLVPETGVGGDILDVAIASPNKGYAIIATPSFVNELIAFNPNTGAQLGGAIYAPGDYVLNDMELSGDFTTLLLGDRKATSPGIRCYDVSTDAQIGGVISVGLPPFDIVVGQPVTTGVSTPPAATFLGANYPNPFNPSTSIPFTLARDGRVTLRIVDVTGRVVATLADGVQPAGPHVVEWNGRNANGAAMPSGVYFARLESADNTAVRKVVLLK